VVTLKDVAKKAGVSTASVSMVINKKGLISPKTTKKIEKAIEDLNYTSNFLAQSLVTKRSYTIGLVVGSLKNSYFTEIISTVENVAKKKGYSVFICDAQGSSENALKDFVALQSRGVDGILFSLSFSINDSFIKGIKKIQNNGIPLISLTECVTNCDIPIVTFTDKEETYLLIQKMIKLGHKKVGAVGGPRGSWLNNSRLDCFNRVLREWNLFNEEYIYYSDLSIQSGYIVGLELLKKFPELTAIYAINDVVAIGVIQAAKELGINVPEELSVVGGDGIPVSNLITPKLTTVIIPKTQLSQIATENLIGLIDKCKKDETDKATTMLIPCSIREGESLKKVRNL
jgi:DNA-binding LacI/PurR family transcriptional regulator